MTPMQKQYNEIKSQHPNDVVLFRLGDFYETFNSDAETVSRVLGITLTGRGKGETRVPMAGIPHHALPSYLPKMVQAGLKVVVVDQKSAPVQGKLVERDVSKIYTPGTLTELNNLEDNKPNYLVSLVEQKGIFGFAALEVSTGQLLVWQNNDLVQLLNEIGRLGAVECIVPINTQLKQQIATQFPALLITEWQFPDGKSAYEKLTKQFTTTNLKSFGIEELSAGQLAAAAAIDYAIDCHRTQLDHIKSAKLYPHQQFMQLDSNTIRNLEILYPNWGDYRSTLYYHLNKCSTAMGRRLLREWLIFPLLDQTALHNRWEAVAQSKSNTIVSTDLAQTLQSVPDIARLNSRVATNAANGRELWALVNGLQQVESVHELLESISKASKLYSDLDNQVQLSKDLVTYINELSQALNPEPPQTITEGGLIASGFDAEIDELRSLRSGGKNMMAEIQAREISATGITSLKVGFNNVFGYYLEVTNTHLAKVPDTYIRKQTIANGERFITQELKELESKILNAENLLYQKEYDLFCKLRAGLVQFSSEILRIADALAQLDVINTLGIIARENRYVQPEISAQSKLKIKLGRHPVVEALQPNFHANDLNFDQENYFAVLTGPNMSGKSTYIRQVALITLMAQAGSFVPATEFKFSLVDRIFTRVGASDNLARGESTFMVEMQETANILHNATSKSLVILDEVGRGTSTYDGVAIAWAIAEDLITRVKAKTLFATHYHELTALEKNHNGVINLHVQVSEQSGEVVFTHHIADGGTNRSYGVHVAKLAGLPLDVVKKAEDILKSFEQDTAKASQQMKSNGSQPKKPQKLSPGQLTLEL